MDGLEAPHPHNLLRKNGKLQSCEPCRKSKLACDHVVPCGRCSRLNRIEQCVYDPAPVSNSGNGKKRKLSDSLHPEQDSTFSAPITPKLSPIRTHEGSSCHLPSESQKLTPCSTTGIAAPVPRKSTTHSVVIARAHPRPPGLSHGSQKRPSIYRPGYMGRTAYGAVLNEYGPSLQNNFTDDSATPSTADNEVVVDAASVELGAEILLLLPCQDVSRKTILKYFEKTVSCSIHLPTLWHFHEAFWKSYGSYLDKPRKREKLLTCAKLMSRRASRVSLPTSFAANSEYLDALTNRWEMLGVLFSAFAASRQMHAYDDEIIHDLRASGIETNDVSICMLEAAEACLRLVDQLDTGLNVMVAFLGYRCSHMQSYLGQRGDTNYSYWRRNHQLCGDMTALGFHRLSEPVVGQPGSILFTEQQKRLFVSAFMHDKHLAVYLGRPPTLSKRYVSMKPVLDASDEALMNDDLASIQSSLNEFGYNKAGALYRATVNRVFFFCAMIYEDILEISLGTDPLYLNRVKDVKAQLVEQYQQQPSILHRTIDRDLFSELTLFESFAAVEIQLINLHQHFLLDRIEHGTERINFGVAEEMLRIVLVFWNEREQYPGHTDDNHWTICCYGIPAASSIAVGLWKASESLGNHSWRNSRSENIQNVSLFIACLDWVKPADGNYELCQRTMGMLKDILDRVLAPPAAEVPTPQNDFTQLWDLTSFSLAGMPTFGTDVDDLFSSDWMSAPRANLN